MVTNDWHLALHWLRSHFLISKIEFGQTKHQWKGDIQPHLIRVAQTLFTQFKETLLYVESQKGGLA